MENKHTTAVTDVLSSLQEVDSAHLWHPYTQAQTAPVPQVVKRAYGAKLYTEDGDSIIDAISSWWVTLHGHGHPVIAERLIQQVKTLEHVMFAGFTHQPAVELAERLTRLLPTGLERVFYSDNGTSAVETALKMAMQYHYNCRGSGVERSKIIILEGGFCGESLATMACSDRNLFSKPFEPLLFDVATVPAPTPGNEQRALEAMERHLADGRAACFIFEPLVQAVSGMRFHTAEALDPLLRLCADQGVLTIADEVFTGMGRLGPLFASAELSQTPDFICLAKTLTGGFLPLGATVTTQRIYEAFLSEERGRALLHGHSYTGNPLGCVAAVASLDLLEEPQCELRRHSIEEQHRRFQQEIQGHPKVANCRVKGTLLALDYATGESSYYSSVRDRLAQHFMDHRVLIRPFGNHIHLVPPYCISEQELETVYRSILSSFEVLG